MHQKDHFGSCLQNTLEWKSWKTIQKDTAIVQAGYGKGPDFHVYEEGEEGEEFDRNVLREEQREVSGKRKARFRGVSWRRAWQPTSVFLFGESHRQRSLVGYSSQGRKESDMTESTSHTHKIGIQDDISLGILEIIDRKGMLRKGMLRKEPTLWKTETRGREIPGPNDIVIVQIQPCLNMPEHLQTFRCQSINSLFCLSQA